MPANPHRIPVSRSLKRSGAAFTLIELLVVMGVLGVVMGLGAMSMGTLRSTSMSTSTRLFADFMNLCRSQAISQRSAIRVGIVVKSDDPNEEFRRFSAWTWNKRSRQFEQSHQWKSLPGDLVFEPVFPEYLKESEHAERDVSSIRGDYLLASIADEMVLPDEKVIRFFQFSPAGRASQDGADLRNLILVMRPGEVETQFDGSNWAQFNIDTLTGRVRIYRP